MNDADVIAIVGYFVGSYCIGWVSGMTFHYFKIFMEKLQ